MASGILESPIIEDHVRVWDIVVTHRSGMIPAVTLRLQLLSAVWLICPSFPRRIEFVLDIRILYAVSPSSRSSTLTCVHHDVFYFSLYSSHLHRNCICSLPEARLASDFRACHQTFSPSSRRFQHVGLIQILHFLKYQLIFCPRTSLLLNGSGCSHGPVDYTFNGIFS